VLGKLLVPGAQIDRVLAGEPPFKSSPTRAGAFRHPRLSQNRKPTDMVNAPGPERDRPARHHRGRAALRHAPAKMDRRHENKNEKPVAMRHALQLARTVAELTFSFEDA
jgi:hypothetical protein